MPGLSISPSSISILYDSTHNVSAIPSANTITCTASGGTINTLFSNFQASNNSFSSYVSLTPTTATTSKITYNVNNYNYKQYRGYAYIIPTSGSPGYYTSGTCTINATVITFTVSKPTMYSGDSTTITVTNVSGATYTWSGTNITTPTNTYTISANPTAVSTTTYTYNLAFVYNSLTLNTSQNIVVNPAITISSDRTITSVGDTSAYVNFTATVLNATTYKWYWTGATSGNTGDLTTNTYTFIPTSSFVGTVNFYCVATNTYGSTTTSSSIPIFVLGQAAITLSPTSPTYMYSTSLGISSPVPVSSTVTSGYTISNQQWYGNGSSISGQTASSYTINNTTYTSLQLKSTFYVSGYNPDPYTVSPNPVESSTIPVNLVNLTFTNTKPYIYTGTFITLSITNSTNISYSWFASPPPPSGIIIGGSTYQITTTPDDVSSTTVINYICTTTANSNSNSLSPSTTVTVYPQASLASDRTITSVGDTSAYVNFTASANANVNNTVTYVWYWTGSQSGSVSTGTTNTYQFIPTSSFVGIVNFYYIATNQYGSSSTSNILPITVLNQAVITLTPSSPLYYMQDAVKSINGSLPLTPTYTSGYTISNQKWYGNPGTVQVATGVDTYTISSSTYSSYYETATFSSGTYTVTPNPITSNSLSVTSTNIIFQIVLGSVTTPLNALTTVYMYSGDTINISVNNLAFATYAWATNYQTITGSTTTYQINASPTASSNQTARYSLALKANSNISTLNTYQDITINPIVTVSTSNSSTYVGGPSITVSATADNVSSYTWTDSKGRSYADAASITYTPTDVADLGTLIFQCIVTNGFGSTSTSIINANSTITVYSSVTMAVLPSSPILFYDTTNSVQGSITLQSQITSSTSYFISNYQWYGNTSTAIGSATSSTYAIIPTTTPIYTTYAFSAQFVAGTTSFTQQSPDTTLTVVNLSFTVPRPIIYVNANQSSTISITGGYSYTWTANTTSGVNPNILSGASTNSITIQPTVSGTLGSSISMIYYVNVTNNDSSTLSTSTTISIEPQVTITQSQSITSLYGTPITFTANVATPANVFTYAWSDSQGLGSYANSASITFDPSVYTSYTGSLTFTCVVTNIYGSSTTNTSTITILNQATISITPSTPYFLTNSSLAQTGSTVLTANDSIATGSTQYTPSSQQWYGNVINAIGGATSTTYTVTDISTYTQYLQKATLSYLTYSLTNITSNNVTFTSTDFSLSPSKLVIYTGDTLQITATSYGYVSYVWSSSSSNANITGGASSNVVSATPTYPILAPHTITYNLALSANGGAATLSTSQTITVSPQIVLTANPPITYLNNPTSVTLTASADGAVSYAWSDSLGNTYSGTPIIFTPSSAVNVTFTCTATNAYGSTTTNTILVKVLGEPTITLSPSTPYYLYDLLNGIYGSLTLSASYTSDYNVTNNDWYGNPGGDLVGSGSSYVVTNNTYSSYYQQALFTSIIIPSYSTTITSSDLNINDENIVFTTPKPIVYTGDTLTIAVNNQAYLSYQWSSSSSNANITGGATTYQVTAQPTNTSGVAQNKVYQIALSANSGVSTLTTSQTIEVDPQVTISATYDVIFINSFATTLTATVLNGVNYAWSDDQGIGVYPNAASITYDPSIYNTYTGFLTFTCIVTNAYGSTTQNTYTIEILALPTITISPASPYFLKTSVVNGTTTLTGTFAPGLTFVSGSGQWYGDGNLIVGATAVSYNVTNSTYSTYYLTAILNDGAIPYPVTSQTVTLTTTTLSLSPNYTINYSTNPVIISLLAQQSYLTYLWSSTSGNANIVSGSTTYQVTAEPSVSSTEIIPYQVVTTANSGAATLTVIQNITILKELEIQIQILSSMPYEMVEEGNLTVSPNVVTLFYGNSIQFTAIANDVVSYEWYDDKGRSYPSTQTIIYTPDSDVGYVYISCKVTNSVGATQTRTVIIQVLPNIILSKTDVKVYYTDEVYVKAIGGNSYQWVAINRSEYLPNSCYPTFDTDIMRFIPERDYEYQVTAYDGLGNESIGYVKISVIPKPMEVLQNDLIPMSLYEDVLHRRKNVIIEKLKRDTNLLSQLTQFYNVQLQTAYKMEFQAKQGRGYRVPWISKYQITNQTNQMLVSFEQQYQLLRYLLNAPNCNLSFLINIIQYNFVLRSCNQPKDYYLQGPITR